MFESLLRHLCLMYWMSNSHLKTVAHIGYHLLKRALFIGYEAFVSKLISPSGSDLCWDLFHTLDVKPSIRNCF